MASPMLLLERFHDPLLRQEDLLARLAWLRDVVGPRLERFLGYYRNATSDLAAALPGAPGAGFSVRPFRQYQELGLPARITGFRRAADGACAATGAMDVQRKEVVIENDIAWRMDTLVDFAAGRAPGITSTARDPALRARLDAIIASLLDAVPGAEGNGLLHLLQTLVLQGAISGSAWVRLRPTAELLARLTDASPTASNTDDTVVQADFTRVDTTGIEGAKAGESWRKGCIGVSPETAPISLWLNIDVVETRRVCPAGTALAILRDTPSSQPPAAKSDAGFLQRLRSWFGGPLSIDPTPEDFSFDLFGPAWWQRYDRGILSEEGENPLRVVPLVKYENAPDPAAGTRVGPAGGAAVNVGLGELEPLIGLQDELNTRLSDRAYRVTMSSFQMYLGKGIDDFIKRPVGPGQMWGTDNPDATIQTFGGDKAAPSEAAHIEEVREALDKISGVSPVAAGIIRGKLGNLTSAVALRLTLIALLARTERKRATLTQVLGAVVRLALETLDRAGVVKTAPEDRGIDVNWPTALPESDMDRLTEAQAKLALGVPREVVFQELGYGELVHDFQPAPTAPPPASAAGAGPG